MLMGLSNQDGMKLTDRLEKSLAKFRLDVWWKVGIVGGLLAGIRFWPFFLGKTLYYGDNFSLLVPGKLFTIHWLKQGIIPLWNPTVLAGIPWIGDISQSIFYPSTLIFLLFSPGLALSLTILLHYWWTFMGSFWLGKTWSGKTKGALLVAVLWTLSTQVTGSVNNLATLQAITWIPWVVGGFLSISKGGKSLLILIASLTGMILAGYPPLVAIAVLTGVVLSLYWQGRKVTLRKWAVSSTLSLVLALGLSAPVIGPFYQALSESTRGEQTIEQAGLGSLKIPMSIKFLFPYFFDKPDSGMKWGPAWSGQPNVFMYFSWGVLMAVVVGLLSSKFRLPSLQTKLLLGGAFGSIVLSLGSAIPGFTWLIETVSVVKASRYPAMFLIVATLLLILWLSKVVESKPKNLIVGVRIMRWLGWVAILSLVVGLIIWWQFEPLWNTADRLTGYVLSTSLFHTLDRDWVIVRIITVNVIGNLFLGWVALKFWLSHRWRLFVVIVAVDLLINTQGMLFYATNDLYATNDSELTAIDIPLTHHNTRILTRNFNQPYTDYGMYWEAMTTRAPFSDSFVDALELEQQNHLRRIKMGLTPNWNMVYGIKSILGYVTLLPRDFNSLWNEENTHEARVNYLASIEPDNSLLAEWAVTHYLVDYGFEVLEDISEFELEEKVGDIAIYSIPNSLPRWRYSDGSEVIFSDYKETPNRISASFENTQDSDEIISLADRYDPDWQVLVNEKKVDIMNLSGYRSFSVPPGNVTVEMHYSPRLYYAGWMFFGGSLAGVLTLTTIQRMRLKNNHK